MINLYQHIQSFLQSNQFLTGGLVLGVVAGVIHQLRSAPVRTYHWLKRRFIVEVDIPDRDEAFLWIDKWLSAQSYSQNVARELTVRTERPEQDCSTGQPRIILSPAPGHHWFLYKRRLVNLYRERKDSSDENKFSLGIRESFRLRIFARNRAIALSLIEDARELVHPKAQRKVTVLTERYCDWSPMSHQRIRPIDSVILPNGKMELLIDSIQQFLGREDWYFERGIPWRLGILLYGPPGGGKSSSVIALAGHFGMDIALLNLSGFGSSDETLRAMMTRLPPNTIVLLEDVDCLGIDRKKRAEKITFSGFLNAIDGVAASEGRVLFMTTNHPEKLDPALTRPGRTDVRVEIGRPTSEQIARLCRRFFPAADDSQINRFGSRFPKTSMAAAQCHLLKHNTIEDALGNIMRQRPAGRRISQAPRLTRC